MSVPCGLRRNLAVSRIAAAVVVCVIVTAPALAQGRRWSDPYERGRKAFDAGNYAEAVRLLEQAVAIESRQAERKQVEGVFFIPYFPHFYLGAAYLELKQYDKAQQSFAKASNGLSSDLRRRLTDLQGRLTAEARPPAPAPVAPVPGPVRPPPPPPTINAAFVTALRQADMALLTKQYAAALAGFDAAKAADAAEYGRQNVQTRRDEAAQAFALELSVDGQRMLNAGTLNQAKAAFQHAEQIASGKKPAQDGLAEIKRREDEFQRLKAASSSDAQAGNFAAARDKLEQARSTHPELFASESLGASLESYAQRIASQKPPERVDSGKGIVDGRGLNPKNQVAAAPAAATATSKRVDPLTRDGAQLEKPGNVAAVSLTGEQQYDVVLKQGLLALFKDGDASKSIGDSRIADRPGNRSSAGILRLPGGGLCNACIIHSRSRGEGAAGTRHCSNFVWRAEQPSFQLSTRLALPRSLPCWMRRRADASANNQKDARCNLQTRVHAS